MASRDAGVTSVAAPGVHLGAGSRRKSRKFAELAILILLASALTPAAALAATTTVTGTVNAGSLSLTTSAAPSFSVTLDGTDKTGTYTVPTTVTDATGSGSGWNLTVTSTQFTTGSHTLSTSASSLTGVTSSCVGGATCTNPTNSIGYPVAVPAGSTPPTAVKYFDAAANSGQGQFTNTPSVSVSVPASSYAGSYSSTLTLAVVSGP